MEAKAGFFQQQVLLYSKYVFGKWISGMCSFLNGNNNLYFSNPAYKATSATHLSALERRYQVHKMSSFHKQKLLINRDIFEFF
jgi:hypothetical protein